MMRGSRKAWLVLAAAGVALGAGAIWSTRPISFHKEAFRDVAKLEVTDVTWEPAPGGYRIGGVLVNQDERLAYSVVLTAKVLDESDTLLGANPLINVLRVPARGREAFEVLVPAKASTGRVKVTMEPTVVSWME